MVCAELTEYLYFDLGFHFHNFIFSDSNKPNTNSENKLQNSIQIVSETCYSQHYVII